MGHRIVWPAMMMLVVVTACGGSTDDDSGTEVPSASAVATTQIPDTVETTVTPPADSGMDDGEMSPLNCPELMAAISSAANAAAATVTGNEVADLPSANMRAIADRIPEISDDLNIVADAYDAFFMRLAELGVDLTDPSSIAGLDAEAMEQITAASEALEAAEVVEANENVASFFERECS